jgi:hypothetical protein
MLSPSVGKREAANGSQEAYGVAVEYGWMAGMAVEALLAL